MLNRFPENHGLWTRRDLLAAAGAVTVGTTLATIARAQQPLTPGPSPAKGEGSSEPLAPGPSPGTTSVVRGEGRSIIQIGILLGTFSRPTLEARLDATKACGLRCVQLSMNCAGLAAMPDEIPAEAIERIRRAADARGIEIASLQGTFNMCHPDAEHRRVGVRRLGVLAAAGRALGVSKIHICTGTRSRRGMWDRDPGNDSPEAWRDMVACVGAAVEIVKPYGATLGFEPEVNNVVDSAKKARRLMDEIGSPHLKVTMDAANLFHAGEFAKMSEVLDRAFALVGRDIVMAHAKDVSRDGDAGHEAAGHGKLDYARYLSLLRAYGFKGPLFLHSLSEAQVPGCVAFLRKKLSAISGRQSAIRD